MERNTTDQCAWKPDDDGIYHTDCGHEFVFIDDGPTQNHMMFCCYCGKALFDDTRCGQVRYCDATDEYQTCRLFPKHAGPHIFGSDASNVQSPREKQDAHIAEFGKP